MWMKIECRQTFVLRTQGRRSRHLQPLADVSNQIESFPVQGHVTAPYIGHILRYRYPTGHY
jgi:hypothetical protein